MSKSARGFTIVELLIVIVVIAILAAISIVAYNGIQSRAKVNQQTAAIAQYVKAIQVYIADKGSLPVVIDKSGNAFACINPPTSSPPCYGSATAETITFTNTLTTNMKDFISGTPAFLSGEPVLLAMATGASIGTSFEDDTYFWARFPVVLDSCPNIGGLRPTDGGLASYEIVGSKTVCRYLITR